MTTTDNARTWGRGSRLNRGVRSCVSVILIYLLFSCGITIDHLIRSLAIPPASVIALAVQLFGTAVRIGILFAGMYFIGKISGRTLSDYKVAIHTGDLRRFGVGLIIGIGAMCAVIMILYSSGVYSLGSGHGTPMSILTSLVMFIGVGVTEEYMFRGVLLFYFLRWGRFWALMLTSVLFTAGHLVNPGVTLVAAVNMILGAVFWGLCVVVTGSVYLSAGIHTTWNWFIVSIAGVRLSGLDFGNGLFTTHINTTAPVFTGGDFGPEAALACTGILIALNAAVLIYYHRLGVRIS